MSRLMTKPTKRHVCPAKTQISLGIRPVILLVLSWGGSNVRSSWSLYIMINWLWLTDQLLLHRPPATRTYQGSHNSPPIFSPGHWSSLLVKVIWNDSFSWWFSLCYTRCSSLWRSWVWMWDRYGLLKCVKSQTASQKWLWKQRKIIRGCFLSHIHYATSKNDKAK